jgi:hypothetical protein
VVIEKASNSSKQVSEKATGGRICVTLHGEVSLHRSLVVTLSVWGEWVETQLPFSTGLANDLDVLELVVKETAEGRFVRKPHPRRKGLLRYRGL